MNIANYFILGNERVKGNCLKAIESLPLGMYEVRIAKVEKNRTTRQNRFYWGPWLQTFADWMGEKDKDYLHKQFKVRFLGVEKSMVAGEILIEPKSTAKLSIEEFGVFLNKVEGVAMEMGITLPSREYHGVSE